MSSVSVDGSHTQMMIQLAVGLKEPVFYPLDAKTCIELLIKKYSVDMTAK